MIYAIEVSLSPGIFQGQALLIYLKRYLTHRNVINGMDIVENYACLPHNNL